MMCLGTMFYLLKQHQHKYIANTTYLFVFILLHIFLDKVDLHVPISALELRMSVSITTTITTDIHNIPRRYFLGVILVASG